MTRRGAVLFSRATLAWWMAQRARVRAHRWVWRTQLPRGSAVPTRPARPRTERKIASLRTDRGQTQAELRHLAQQQESPHPERCQQQQEQQ